MSKFAVGLALDKKKRLKLFDAATKRQRVRQAARSAWRVDARGWNRDELYQRGRTLAD